MYLQVSTLSIAGVLSASLLAQPPAPPPAETGDPYLVKNINPAGSSSPGGFVTYRGVTYFRADDGASGSELWRTDGTEGGTTLVHDSNPGSASSAPVSMTGFDGRVYFAATTAEQGRELWSSDGTAEGTRLVSDINPGTLDSQPSTFLALRNVLLFRAQNAAGLELWQTEGRPPRTTMIADLHPGPEGSIPTFLTALGDAVYFGADDKFTPGVGFDRELWKLDVASGRLTRVRDINPGPGPSIPSALTTLGRQVLFQAGEPQGGVELWRSDGTEAGTVRVRDIVAGVGSSAPTGLRRVGSRIYFSAGDAERGRELWVSDGSAVGTTLVKDINPGPNGSEPLYATPFRNGFLFNAEDGEHGRELWFSDGTEAGTRLVRDVNPGPANASPLGLVVAGGEAYFVTIRDAGAGDNTVSTELWKSDGTEEGTRVVWQAPGRAAGYAIGELAFGDGHLFFVGPTSVDAEGMSADHEPHAIAIARGSLSDDSEGEVTAASSPDLPSR